VDALSKSKVLSFFRSHGVSGVVGISLSTLVLILVLGSSEFIGCTGHFPDFKGGRWPSSNILNPRKTTTQNTENAGHKIPVVPVVKETKEHSISPAKVIPVDGDKKQTAESSGNVPKEEIIFFYQVKEPGLSLGLLSQVALGTKDRWQEIAQWNQLKTPYHLYVGQKIMLKMPEKLSTEDFNERLLKIWRTKLQDEDTSIHFNDSVRLISAVKKDELNIILFSKHARVYRVHNRQPASSVSTSLLGCLKHSQKTHAPVRIAATRTEHEIVTCE